MSPSTAFGVGTVFDAGRESVSGELKNGSVVYSLIFAVYSASIAIFASRTNGCACCWAAIGDWNSAAAAANAITTNFFMNPPQRIPACKTQSHIIGSAPHRGCPAAEVQA